MLLCRCHYHRAGMWEVPAPTCCYTFLLIGICPCWTKSDSSLVLYTHLSSSFPGFASQQALFWFVSDFFIVLTVFVASESTILLEYYFSVYPSGAAYKCNAGFFMLAKLISKMCLLPSRICNIIKFFPIHSHIIFAKNIWKSIFCKNFVDSESISGYNHSCS